MYDQCMGDGYNNNQYYGEPCGGYGQWPLPGGSYQPTPWCQQCGWNNWNWYNGYNNYDASYPTAGCQHFYAQNYGGLQVPPMNEPKADEYKLYQRRFGGHYMKQEAAANMAAEPPLWKSVKIDCFSAKMDVHKTQSELLRKSTLNKTTTRRKTRKRKLGVTRSTTTLKNVCSKLGRKVHLKGGGLAYILFKPKDGEGECDEANRDAEQHQVPFTYYPSKKQHDLEKEFLEEINRRFNETPTRTSHNSRHKQFIENLNKLYTDIGGGLGTGTKRSVSQCTPQELDEIRHEFEVFFNQTGRSSKQTQTKLKMKTLKSNKSKSRTKWTMSADLTRHLRKSPLDVGKASSKSTKKSKIKVPAIGRGAPSTEKQPSGKESRRESKLHQMGSENGKPMSGSRLWRTAAQKERTISTTPRSAFVSFKTDEVFKRRKASAEKPTTSAHLRAGYGSQGSSLLRKSQVDKPRPSLRATYANFNYTTAWARK